MTHDLRREIQQALESLPEELQQQSADALDSLDGLKVVSARSLSSLVLNREESDSRRATIAWLVGIAKLEELVPSLEALLTRETPVELVWEAAKALCALSRGEERLLELLSDSAAGDRRRASAFALGCLRASGAVDVLGRILVSTTEEPALRGQAAEALGYIGGEEALPHLLAGARDAVAEVRYWVAFALGELRDGRARPILEEMARTDQAEIEHWGTVAAEAKEALKRLPSKDPF